MKVRMTTQMLLGFSGESSSSAAGYGGKQAKEFMKKVINSRSKDDQVPSSERLKRLSAEISALKEE